MASKQQSIAWAGGFARWRWFWLLAALGTALWVWWPGDTTWINDEPILLLHAWQANAAGHLAPVGIDHPGSTGIYYHPVTTWFYQPLLAITHDLVAIAGLKALLTTLAMVLGLAALARETETPRWPVLLALLSPWLYLANRHLWDNVQLVPLVPWFFWCLARALRRHHFAPVAGGLVLAVWMFHIHVIAAIVIAAWGLTLLVWEWRWLTRIWGRTLLAGGLAVAAIMPYVASFIGHVQQKEDMLEPTHLIGLVHGWYGLQILTGLGLKISFPELWQPGSWVPVWLWCGLVWLSSLGIGLGLWGAVDWGRRLRREWRAGEVSLRVKVGTAAALTFGLTMLLYTATRQYPRMHYFHASWWAAWWFVAGGAELAWASRPGHWLTGTYVAALGGVLVCFALHIHVNGGNRGPFFGATLANQVAVGRKVVRYRPGLLTIKVSNYALFPQAYQDLYTILSAGWPPGQPVASIELVYRDGEQATTGWIEAVVPPRATPGAAPLPAPPGDPAGSAAGGAGKPGVH